MFNVGLGEIILTLIIAILIIKPQDIPKISQLIGLQFRRLKNSTDKLTAYWYKLLEADDD